MNRAALLLGLLAVVAIIVVVYVFYKSPKLEGFQSLKTSRYRSISSTGGCPPGTQKCHLTNTCVPQRGYPLNCRKLYEDQAAIRRA